VTLEDEKLSDKAKVFNGADVMFPPQIQTKPYQMHILLIKGEKLKKMDKFGTVDPVLKIDYAGIKIQSSIIKKDQNPHWNEEILVIII
jgi:Ca2+-dependent lipid-binding protein, contains C2 domain